MCVRVCVCCLQLGINVCMRKLCEYMYICTYITVCVFMYVCMYVGESSECMHVTEYLLCAYV